MITFQNRLNKILKFSNSKGIKMTFLKFAIYTVVGILLCGSTSNALTENNTEKHEKVTIGWLEKAYLLNYDFAMRAKMDTGAKNSSIHATDMEYVSVEGKPPRSRIQFKTVDTVGNTRTIEADIIREVYIKKSSLNSESPLKEARLEIELEICLAGVKKKIQVNLTNREGMNYRMLLGRTALEGNFIVDAGHIFIGGKKCRSFVNQQ